MNLIFETEYQQSNSNTTNNNNNNKPPFEIYLDSHLNIPFPRNSLPWKIWNSMIYYSNNIKSGPSTTVSSSQKINSNEIFSTIVTLSELLNGILKNGDHLHPLTCHRIGVSLPSIVENYPDSVDLSHTDIDIPKIQATYFSISLRYISNLEQQPQKKSRLPLISTTQKVSTPLPSSSQQSQQQHQTPSIDKLLLKDIKDICNYSLSQLYKDKNTSIRHRSIDH